MIRMASGPELWPVVIDKLCFLDMAMTAFASGTTTPFFTTYTGGSLVFGAPSAKGQSYHRVIPLRPHTPHATVAFWRVPRHRRRREVLDRKRVHAAVCAIQVDRAEGFEAGH